MTDPIQTEATESEQQNALNAESSGIPSGEALTTDFVDTFGVIVLKAGTVIPNDTARDFLLEEFGPLRASAPEPDSLDDDTGMSARESGSTDSEQHRDGADGSDNSNSPSTDHPPTPADLGLEIGALLRLQPPKSTGIGALGCRVIGVAPNHSIFVTPPTASGRAVNLVVGERLSVVYVSRRSVFGFVCTVQSTFRQPFEYVLLSPPGPISRLRARSALRARVRFFALAGQASDQTFDSAGIIRNLSASGMNLSAREGLASINDVLRISFCFHTVGRDHHLDVRGRVRHVRRDDTPGRVSYGIQLDDLSAHDRLLLAYHVLEQSGTER